MNALGWLLQPAVLPWVALALGLCVGSFLNVVIHRLPKMMEREWRAECAALEGREPSKEAPDNLVVPRSCCHACGHAITALENIPLVSYLALRGKCSACGARIGIKYPVVELLAGLAAAYSAWRFGPSLAALGAALFVWFTLALAFIDQETGFLPDALTLLLVWIGLVLNVAGAFVAARGGDRRRGRLSIFVAGLLGLQAGHRQGRHGIRRLQDERRGGSVSGLEDAAAGDPAFLARRPRLRRAANVRGARPLGRRVPLSFRTVSRDRRRGRALLGRSHRAVVRAEAVSFVIGLTGGIGSGKSAAAEEFARLGASVVDTDAIARELTGRGGAALPKLERLFGAEFIAASGAMDRKKMRERVFSDPAAKRALEALLHPLIREESQRRIAAAGGPYVVHVVPLLVESPDYRQRVDRVLVVDAPEEVQVARVLGRG